MLGRSSLGPRQHNWQKVKPGPLTFLGLLGAGPTSPGVTQVSGLSVVLGLVECATVHFPILHIFAREPSRFRFALGPAHCVASPAVSSRTCCRSRSS